VLTLWSNGSGSVTEGLISDSTPAFSALEQPVQCPAALPAGIGSCQIVMPAPASNVAGYEGPVKWQFNGALAAGAGGQVWFEIRIQ